MKVVDYPIEKILIDEAWNCRSHITPHSILEMARDMKHNGQMTPVVLGPEINGKRKLLAGYRRIKAAIHNKWPTIAASLRDDLEDEIKQVSLNFRENIQRVELNIVEETKALVKMFELGLSETEIAKEINKTKAWVSLRNKIRQLPMSLWPDIEKGIFTQTHINEMYESLINDSPETFAFNVRLIKKKRVQGNKKFTLKEAYADKEKPKIRTSNAIFKLQGRVQRMAGRNGCIEAIVLGWAAGAISDVALEAGLKEYYGDDYVEPTVDPDFINV